MRARRGRGVPTPCAPTEPIGHCPIAPSDNTHSAESPLRLSRLSTPTVTRGSEKVTIAKRNELIAAHLQSVRTRLQPLGVHIVAMHAPQVSENGFRIGNVRFRPASAETQRCHGKGNAKGSHKMTRLIRLVLTNKSPQVT